MCDCCGWSRRGDDELDDASPASGFSRAHGGVVSHEGVLRRKKEDHGKFEDAYKELCVCRLRDGVICVQASENGMVADDVEQFDLRQWRLLPRTDKPDRFSLTNNGDENDVNIVTFRAESKAEGSKWVRVIKETTVSLRGAGARRYKAPKQEERPPQDGSLGSGPIFPAKSAPRFQEQALPQQSTTPLPPPQQDVPPQLPAPPSPAPPSQQQVRPPSPPQPCPPQSMPLQRPQAPPPVGACAAGPDTLDTMLELHMQGEAVQEPAPLQPPSVSIHQLQQSDDSDVDHLSDNFDDIPQAPSAQVLPVASQPPDSTGDEDLLARLAKLDTSIPQPQGQDAAAPPLPRPPTSSGDTSSGGADICQHNRMRSFCKECQRENSHSRGPAAPASQRQAAGDSSSSAPRASSGPTGVGIVLKENRQRTSTTLLVSGLAPRGPADVCGLIQIGDVLLKVDGKDVDSTEKASKLILGERGSKIAMVFKRFNADKIEKFTVHMERGGGAPPPAGFSVGRGSI